MRIFLSLVKILKTEFEKEIRNRFIVGQSLMFYSDRGVLYASKNFVAILDQYGCIQSMSRKGNCWDNAVAESFFKTLKTELMNKYKFTTPKQLYIALFDYIDGWYNTTIYSLNGLVSILTFKKCQLKSRELPKKIDGQVAAYTATITNK